MKKSLTLVVLISFLSGCASTPQVAVDPKSIKDVVKFEKDKDECTAVATSYDLSEKVGANTAVGAVAGGAAVAGIATAVAGAIFLPALPFIAAGTFFGGGLGGGLSKQEETQAREKILAECMTERGYKTYAPK
jgi:hypothetical protein